MASLTERRGHHPPWEEVATFHFFFWYRIRIERDFRKKKKRNRLRVCSFQDGVDGGACQVGKKKKKNYRADRRCWNGSMWRAAAPAMDAPKSRSRNAQDLSVQLERTCSRAATNAETDRLSVVDSDRKPTAEPISGGWRWKITSQSESSSSIEDRPCVAWQRVLHWNNPSCLSTPGETSTRSPDSAVIDLSASTNGKPRPWRHQISK